jgi:hypothetical protein
MLLLSSAKALRMGSTITTLVGHEFHVCDQPLMSGSQLCQWLWPVLLQKELVTFMEFRNGARMRKDKNKPGPSGMSRNDAFSLPSSWGGRNCLLPVDIDVIREIKVAMGGDAILEFVSVEFSQQAQVAFDSLGISELTFQNVWTIFEAMLPLLYN